ncbi:hypothetical protein PZA11_007197 [Diplocarpon coronariae]|uniref:Uncharacterized protein n=1 Tax=Diplocarpon coronariae TaxID=2795749 RepID=A0A218YTF3_9HELO|nr:hypothetical protein JHW43_001332 [Diplocarpon mali]OWO98050.1 hypothetical protein B2J93_8275 [Marssonina coronariae]
MSTNKEKLLSAEDLNNALKRLDLQMAKNDFLGAFAPINVVSAGGYLAVTYFENRQATGDIDYIIDPQFRKDDDIKTPLKEAIRSVAKKEKFDAEWMNNEMEIWATHEACVKIFDQAYKQNIVLFDEKSLKVWAAPFEWALERKIKRIANSGRGAEMKVDMNDALVLFKHFRDANNGPLDMEHYRNLNTNGFDIMPEVGQMEKIAANYQDLYKQDLFHPPAAADATSSYAATSAASANT